MIVPMTVNELMSNWTFFLSILLSVNRRTFLTCVCVLCSVSVFCVLCSVFINCVLKYWFFEHEIKLFTKIKIFCFI